MSHADPIVADLAFHEREFRRLLADLEAARDIGLLPDMPSARPALHDLLSSGCASHRAPRLRYSAPWCRRPVRRRRPCSRAATNDVRGGQEDRRSLTATPWPCQGAPRLRAGSPPRGDWQRLR